MQSFFEMLHKQQLQFENYENADKEKQNKT